MRLLLLSDIHANRFGLEATLHASKGQYDQMLCLGDVVGYGVHPNECCEILRDAKSWCLLGNHDAAAINRLSIADFNPIASEALKWTREQLNVINITWLESLKSELDRPEESFQAVHGSLQDPLEEYITGIYTARPTLSLMNHSVCFFGLLILLLPSAIWISRAKSISFKKICFHLAESFAVKQSGDI